MNSKLCGIKKALFRQQALAVTALLAMSLVGGCAVSTPPSEVSAQAPAEWHAPLPHDGSLRSLSDWWQRQGDPFLAELIDAAQQVSPSITTARSNIEQARAARAVSGAAQLPDLNATGSASRSKSSPVTGIAAVPINLTQLGLQTSWEIDVFGRNQAGVNAAQARLDGAQAQWHDARVSVAAEVARQYYALRTCEKLVQVTSADANSRSETARLSALSTKAGFEAPATAALARASAAESRARATQQRAQCDIDVKALVALTALDEPVLRQKLALGLPAAPASAQAQDISGIGGVSSVPADVLEQRPDVFNAAREVAAASFEVGGTAAERYPRLSLAGVLTASRISTGSLSQRFDTWSIGPLSLSVPIFDGGASQANLDAARARYIDAASKYRGAVRQAVREVEEALVTLQSTAERADDETIAAEGYSASFAGTEARYKAGLASLVELEDARRLLLTAQRTVVNLELERRNAWVALYRALGGGWNRNAPEAPPLRLQAQLSRPSAMLATGAAAASERAAASQEIAQKPAVRPD